MSEDIKNLSVSIEQDEYEKWSLVVRVDGKEDAVYPVASREHGEELVKECLPLMMPILTAAAQRGESVSFTANMKEAG